MRFLLLLFRNKFRNSRLHLCKWHSYIIFAAKSVPFLRFHAYHARKGLLAKIRCDERYEYLTGFLTNKRIRNDLVTPKRWKRCCTEDLMLEFNNFVEVLITDICCCNTQRERLSPMLNITLCWGSISREAASSFKCLAIACFSFSGTEMSQNPDTSSILHSRPAGEVCEVIILCS